MSHALRLAFRFLTVVAVIVAVSVVFSPRSGPSSPYVSALSDMTAGPAWADPPNCAKEECLDSEVCVSTNHKTRCSFVFGPCVTRVC